MIDKMTELAREMATAPGVRAEVTAFPGGAAMLDVWACGRLFVMAYTPGWKGFGVDEVLHGEGLLEKYDFFSPDFDQAAERLRELLRDAQPSTGEASQEVDHEPSTNGPLEQPTEKGRGRP